jgi:hypothetical protein
LTVLSRPVLFFITLSVSNILNCLRRQFGTTGHAKSLSDIFTKLFCPYVQLLDCQKRRGMTLSGYHVMFDKLSDKINFFFSTMLGTAVGYGRLLHHPKNWKLIDESCWAILSIGD